MTGMMFGTWQDISALTIVSIALVYVAYLVYRRLRGQKAAACGGGCFACPQSQPDANQLITSIGKSESVAKHVSRID